MGSNIDLRLGELIPLVRSYLCLALICSSHLFHAFQAEICIPDFSTECEEETISGKRLAEDELCFDITKTVCSMETARQNNAMTIQL